MQQHRTDPDPSAQERQFTPDPAILEFQTPPDRLGMYQAAHWNGFLTGIQNVGGLLSWIDASTFQAPGDFVRLGWNLSKLYRELEIQGMNENCGPEWQQFVSSNLEKGDPAEIDVDGCRATLITAKAGLIAGIRSYDETLKAQRQEYAEERARNALARRSRNDDCPEGEG